MNYNLRLLLTGLASGTALGTLTVAVRRWQRAGRTEPAMPDGSRTGPVLTRRRTADEREPVLGYDGMDAETLIDWLERTELDSATLREVRSYELRHQAREEVLAALDDLMD